MACSVRSALIRGRGNLSPFFLGYGIIRKGLNKPAGLSVLIRDRC